MIKNSEKKDANRLASYGQGNAAAFGEVDIIAKILDIIGPEQAVNWCVEFGAGNGLSASNSRRFIVDSKYSAVLIEPVNFRYKLLESLYKDNNAVITLESFVTYEGDSTLDNLLANTNIPVEFDFLSIDIDGNDYHVWKAVENYSPKVVIIEFNETVPPSIRFVQDADPRVNQGCGLRSLCELGKVKGYELVCVTTTNAFFVKQEHFAKFDIFDNSPETMHPSPELITHLFVGYDGKIFLTGNSRLRWHSMDISPVKLQQLPKLIQKFPPNYNFIERFIFRIWRFKSNPKAFVQSIYSKRGKITKAGLSVKK